MKLRQYTDHQSRQSIINMLKENNLPVDDIGKNTLLFGYMDNETLYGTTGLEIYDDCALMRSVSIQKMLHGQGLGVALQKELEQIAKSKNINCLYLLTTTAEGFFRKQGFETVKRNEVPVSIQSTTEFSSVCPSTAIIMKKNL